MKEIHESVGKGVVAIDTGYVRPRMDASHLVIDAGRAAFVDTGTTHSVPRLLQALEDHGLERSQVDYIWLTHIHLDHAGGAGALARELPDAVVVVHPRGARHLADPAKLVAGTIAVYGERKYRELYGELIPVPEQRLRLVADDERMVLGEREFRFIDTPGHALHHYCIVDEEQRAVFAGDTFGVSYREFDTANGPFVFPTTTPVHFDPAQLHASIDRIMSFDPRSIYLTHYSRVGDVERLADDLHADIDVFVDFTRRYGDDSQRTRKLTEALYAHLSARLDEHGYDGDEGRRHELLDMDVDLNVQGLEVWRERLRKRGERP